MKLALLITMIIGFSLNVDSFFKKSGIHGQALVTVDKLVLPQNLFTSVNGIEGEFFETFKYIVANE